MGFRTGVRFSSGPLENGIVCCESDLQCRYFYVKDNYVTYGSDTINKPLMAAEPSVSYKK